MQANRGAASVLSQTYLPSAQSYVLNLTSHLISFSLLLGPPTSFHSIGEPTILDMLTECSFIFNFQNPVPSGLLSEVTVRCILPQFL